MDWLARFYSDARYPQDTARPLNSYPDQQSRLAIWRKEVCMCFLSLAVPTTAEQLNIGISSPILLLVATATAAVADPFAC